MKNNAFEEINQLTSNLCIKRPAIKPGNGWRRIGAVVYEKRPGGIKLHMQGIVKLIDGSIIHDTSPPHYYIVAKLIKANGGNRKRGLMAWANTLSNF